MTDKNIFDKDEVKEEKPKFSKSAPFEAKVKKGKVANITASRITIEMPDGTGQSVSFNASKHANLKIGDPIEF